MSDGIPLVEIEPVKDTFITGVAKVDLMGPNARITLYVKQHGTNGDPDENVVVGRIVLAIEDIPGCVKTVLLATCKRVTIPPWLEWLECPSVSPN